MQAVRLMTAPEQQPAQAAELERRATQTPDPAIAQQLWEDAQRARFGGGESQ
jgi:hypothetical protein